MDELTIEQFWQGIFVLCFNYNVINRKICASTIREVRKVSAGIAKITAKNQDADVEWTKSDESELRNWQMRQTNDNEVCEGFVIFYNIQAKKLSVPDVTAISVIDFTKKSYTWLQQLGKQKDNFVITLRNATTMTIDTFTPTDMAAVDAVEAVRWAEHVLKPKLLRWCRSTVIAPTIRSLQLVSIEQYSLLYKCLKEKYSEKVLKFWNDAKESTDPLKFIYEDLAIAAYLIALMRLRSPASWTFADLGCGNGLLVYILNEEGFKCYGYDIRARKIWSLYPEATRKNLIEEAINPHKFKVPSDVDCLIGNHSDELSPWLPVIAAMASYQMKYFLLPCCAYEFSGAKFQRRNSKQSVYQNFYEYALQISQKCGFNSLKDRLKIPSTKRLALIGVERTHNSDADYVLICSEIRNFVAAEMRNYGNATTNDVKLREKIEIVRNCTKIDKNIIAELVTKIFRLLLAAPSKESFDVDSSWQAGGNLTLRDIAESLSKVDLNHIKSEFGGIKTLLRNKREIFEFCGDSIGIRQPKLRQLSDFQNLAVKKRACFFYLYHPNGCPLQDEECTFVHSSELMVCS